MADLRTEFSRLAAGGGSLGSVRVAGMQLDPLRTVRRNRQAIQVFTYEAGGGLHVLLRLKVQPHAVFYLYRVPGGWNATTARVHATSFPNHNEAVWGFEEAWAGGFTPNAPYWLRK